MKEEEHSRDSSLAGAEQDAAERHTSILRDLSAERREKSSERSSARADVVPVEAKGEHAETLVTVGSSKDSREPRRVAIGEAEDGNTSERGRHEFCTARIEVVLA